LKGLDSQEKIKQAKNEYLRKWRKENKEKVKAYQDKYFLKKFEEVKRGDS
jgi:hypothetical protein